MRLIIVFAKAIWWLLLSPHRRKFAKLWAMYKFGGVRLCWQYALERFGSEYSYKPLQNQLSPSQSEYLLGRCSNQPLLSVVVPVYKVKSKWLEKCICSVACQHYRNWELILVDDASRRDDIKQSMNIWALRDNRIHAYYLEQNSGIAFATNFGIKQARGEFIGFLDHDDELTHDALTWIVWTLNKYPDTVWLYSDEDLISPRGKFHTPHFKPDFSPELLLSIMFTCHLSFYSASILNEIGGLRGGFEGAQDHDLALRISEIVTRENIIHIPRVLYHWRQLPSSTAKSIEAKPKAALAGRKAVAEALTRRNLKAIVTSHESCPTLYQITLQPCKFPKVSIIIPTKNALQLLKRCIHSIREHTSYQNYEILIIDNKSDNPSIKEYLAIEGSRNHLKVIEYDKPFNHSDMNNIAVKAIFSDFIVFMNNDIEIISDNWLEQLVATINMDTSIAAVGCLLLYENGAVQHGGIILGIWGTAGHAYKQLNSREVGYLCRLHALQEISGVTCALSLFRRSAFELVGGFDSEKFPESYNDVDICIRLHREGFRCIYNPMVQAIHYESVTRKVSPEELTYKNRLAKAYSEILDKDPFYNPNLSLYNEQFSGFRPFPLEKQIPELRNI